MRWALQWLNHVDAWGKSMSGNLGNRLAVIVAMGGAAALVGVFLGLSQLGLLSVLAKRRIWLVLLVMAAMGALGGVGPNS